jgi:hypothetical protein
LATAKADSGCFPRKSARIRLQSSATGFGKPIGPREFAFAEAGSRKAEAASLMPSTHKKVIVRKMDRDTVSGYVSPSQFIHEGKLELLNTSGTVISMDLREIKGVYFVREFGDSESLTRKTFTSRPRSEGLWVRLRFKDSEILEGLMPADLTQTTPEGFLVNPPDQRSNTQRIFVPRTALESLTVLAVIGATRRQRRGGTQDQRQVPMFEE